MVDIVEKYQVSEHVYSHPLDARNKANAMGLEGKVHVYDVDGQAYYMPGSSHEEYLAALGYPDDEPDEDVMVRAIRAVVAEILGKNDSNPEDLQVLKLDEEQRLVWGWASVTSMDGVPLVDRQGDVMTIETLEKSATDFMLGARNSLTMHKGDPTSTVVHSMLFTPELKKAFGIKSPYEGWLIAVKVNCDETWKSVKEGNFTGFSIGGRAKKRPLGQNQ